MIDALAVILLVVGGAFIVVRLLPAISRVLVSIAVPALPQGELSRHLAMERLRDLFGGSLTLTGEPGHGDVSYSERVLDGVLDIAYSRTPGPDERPLELTTFRFLPESSWEGKPSVATMKCLAPAFVDIDHHGVVVRISAWVEHPLFLKWFRGTVLRLVAELSSSVESVTHPVAPAPCPLVLDLPVPWDAMCQVCGTGLTVERAVHCPKCHTPHHESCWEYAGGCTIYGCTAQNR